MTSTRYAPGRSKGTLKTPMLLVATVRTSPELSLVTFTCAPEMLDPEGSVTVPERAPVPAVCAADFTGSPPRKSATSVAERKSAQQREARIPCTSIEEMSRSIAAMRQSSTRFVPKNSFPRLMPRATTRRLSQHMLLSEWREASRIARRCQEGCFLIESIDFLACSGPVTFVAYILNIVPTQYSHPAHRGWGGVRRR